MAKVRRVAWRPFRIPFRHEFRAAHGLVPAREGFVVMVEDTVGRRGLGEASPLPSFGGGSLAATEQALERVARASLRWQMDDLATGADPKRGVIWKKAGLASFPEVVQAIAETAVRTAACDALGQARGVPLFAVLASAEKGGWDLPQATGGSVPVSAVIAVEDAATAAADARHAVAAGIHTLKLKLTADREADEARIVAVREAVGPAVTLRFDANGAWEPGEARVRLQALAAFEPEFVEQPVADAPGILALMRSLDEAGVPLALDESLVAARVFSTLDGNLQEGDEGAYTPRALILKPALLNLDSCMEFLSHAGEECKVVVTTAFESGIGTALAMHLAGLLPGPRPACGLDTLRFLEGDIVTGVPPVVDGQVTLPERPGLGVELDEPALEHYATGPWREVRA